MNKSENSKEKKKSSFKRSVIKKNARKNVKHHYIRNILIIFITSFIINGGYLLNSDNLDITEITFQDTTYEISGKKSNTEIITDFFNGQNEEPIDENNTKSNNYPKGVLNVFINETTRSGSLVFGILNAFNQLYFHGRVSAFITILIFTILSFAIFSLVQNIIVVGKNRYFLEQRKYANVTVDRILFPYKVKKTLHLSYILFCKYIYQLFWNFTIIGGFIKHYEYFFIPYLLAENPNLTKKEAFTLSKELMRGEKWNTFKLDFSFLGWGILDSLTLGLSSVFYFNTYKECTYAELYINIRIAKKETLPNSELLSDTLIYVNDNMEEAYPEELLPSTSKKSVLQKLDYNQKYDITSYILFFFTFAFVGWCWEVFLHLANDGVFVNRGTMFGPWLPIYGAGGLLILILLKPFRDKPGILFLLSFILCGIVEYSTAWYLETFKLMKWWDYTGYFLNIHGRTCLEVLIVFGLGGCAFTYLFAPLLSNIYKKLKPNMKKIICVILLTFFIIDFAYSKNHPNTGEGITTPVVAEAISNDNEI